MQSAMMVGQWPLGPRCRLMRAASPYLVRAQHLMDPLGHIFWLATAEMFREASPNDLGAA